MSGMAFGRQRGYYLPKRHQETGAAVKLKNWRRPSRGNSHDGIRLSADVENFMAGNLLG
jgi:hypothetical protein